MKYLKTVIYMYCIYLNKTSTKLPNIPSITRKAHDAYRYDSQNPVCHPDEAERDPRGANLQMSIVEVLLEPGK